MCSSDLFPSHDRSGDTITVKDFKFVGVKSFNEKGEIVDEFGNVVGGSGLNLEPRPAIGTIIFIV